jgi:multidrug resistance protein, MATE family
MSDTNIPPMTHDRRNTILALALPTIGGMTSQNILNLVDMAMVGTLGAPALAGVGIGSFLNFMAFAAIAGLASAVQATAARRVGEGKTSECALPLNGGLYLCWLIGLPLTAVLFLFAPEIFRLLNDDPDVLREGVPYFQIRLLGIIAVGMNFSFRGYWTAIKNTRLYFATLLTMHTVNIVLNYVLIFGKFGLPALGTTGAAIGTAASLWLGSAIYFWHGHRLARPSGFLDHLPDATQLRTLLKLGLPSSMQQLFFAAGFTVLFWIVGQVGTREVAVTNVLINITLVVILPGMGLGLAAATLVGQALGRGEPEDAYRWAWDVSKVGVMIFAVLGMVMLLFPKLILGLFLHEPELLELGDIPLRLIGASVAFDGIGLILMQALLGAGASAAVMRLSVGMQWLFFLPAAWLVGPGLGNGLLAIWLVFVGYRALQTAAFISLWQKREWATIRV